MIDHTTIYVVKHVLPRLLLDNRQQQQQHRQQRLRHHKRCIRLQQHLKQFQSQRQQQHPLLPQLQNLVLIQVPTVLLYNSSAWYNVMTLMLRNGAVKRAQHIKTFLTKGASMATENQTDVPSYHAPWRTRVRTRQTAAVIRVVGL